MSGTPSNAHVWSDADVYVGPLSAENPASISEEFDFTWELVGLLDGESGFVHSREENTNDLYAWGGILVRTTRQNFKTSVTFTALESNAVTKELIWPGSSAGQLKVPRPVRKKLALELRDGDTVRRLISAHEVEISLNSDITQNESDIESFEFVATIFPDPEGVLWIEQEGEPGTGSN